MRSVQSLAGAAVILLYLMQCEAGTMKSSNTDRSLSVENDFLLVSFNKEQKGALERILNKLTGRELLSAEMDGRDLYRISAVHRDGRKETISASSAKETAVAVEDRGRVAVVTITNKGHGDLPLSVKAACVIEADSPLIRWRATIENETDLWINEFHFPIAVCAPKLGETADDDYVMQCACDGQLYENPADNFRIGQAYLSSYPGSMSAQLLSFQDPEGGLYYAAHDSDGYMKKLGLRRAKEGMELIAVHLPPMEFGSSYETPYDTVLGVVKGDWHSAADIYKSWATGQPWCAKKIVERNDIPEWLKEGPLFYAVSLRGEYKGKPSLDLPDDILNNAQTYRDQLGRPVTAMLMAWERYGAWITPQYFPPFGGNDTFGRLTAGLRARGDRSLVFLSGLKWTLATHRGNGYTDQADFEGKGKASAIIGEDGQVLLRGKPDADTGQYAEICCGTQVARDLLLAAVEECQRLGLTAVQADQIVGGGQQACYSTEHSHKPGPGRYQYESLHSIFADVLKKGRERDRDFAFGIEEPNELYIPCLSFYHARDYAQNRWPRSGPNVRGVPVFTYLYHEYLIGYGGDSASVGSRESRSAVLMQGLNLVCGKTPGAAVWGKPVDAAELHPDQLAAMKGAAAILKPRACGYLMTGRMLPPLKLGVSSAKVTFYDWKAKKSREIQFPSVLHGVFEAADRSGVGYVFFNWTDSEQEFAAPLTADSLPAGSYDVWKYGVSAQEEKALSGVSLPKILNLSLPPSGSVFLEVVPKR